MRPPLARSRALTIAAITLWTVTAIAPAEGGPAAGSVTRHEDGDRSGRTRDRASQVPRDPSAERVRDAGAPSGPSYRLRRLDAPPANDAFAAAIAISTPFAQTVTTREATTEAGEPQATCAVLSAGPASLPLSGASLWYSIVPSTTRTIRVQAAGDGSPVLAVYRGSSLSSLEEVACNDNETSTGLNAGLSFTAVKGTTYSVQLGAFLGVGGSVTLTASRVYPGSGSSVSGSVTDEGGSPLEGMCVYATSDGTNALTQTGPDGSYALSPMNPGSYRVEFSDCGDESRYLTEWYDDTSSYWDATVLEVDRAISGIDAQLAPGATISGRLTDKDGLPLADMCAIAEGVEWDYAYTDSSGTYRIGGLPPGSYTVSFEDCAEGTYLWEFYPDARSIRFAQPIELLEGAQVTGVDATLARASSVSGVLRAGSGDPVDDACVDVYDERGEWVDGEETYWDGSYRLEFLPAGEYRVVFASCYEDGYVAEWSVDEPDLASADPIHVAEGVDLQGVDAELSEGGVISGHITARGQSFDEACVEAYDLEGREHGVAWVDGTGAYWIYELPAGDLRLWFSDCRTDDVYAAEWYGGTASEIGSIAVHVEDAGETSGIDADLVPEATLDGTVVDAQGQPIEDVCVGGYSTAGRGVGAYETGPDGVWQIDGLHAGGYSVAFFDCGDDVYGFEWFDGAGDGSGATVIQVQGGISNGGFVGTLESAGSITGIVSHEGRPMERICVRAYEPTGLRIDSDVSNEDGTFELRGLGTAPYRIFLRDCWWDDFPDQWFGGGRTIGSAAPVQVSAPEPATLNPEMRLNASVPATLTIQIEGEGSVSPAEVGPPCTATCAYLVSAGTVVEIRAGETGLFLGWRGAGCTGTEPCAVSMTSDRRVRAVFAS